MATIDKKGVAMAKVVPKARKPRISGETGDATADRLMLAVRPRVCMLSNILEGSPMKSGLDDSHAASP